MESFATSAKKRANELRQESRIKVKGKGQQIDQMRCVVCAVCVDTCPTKSLTMDNQYRPALTARGGLEKFTVAGPKRKEPVAADTAKPAKEYFF